MVADHGHGHGPDHGHGRGPGHGPGCGHGHGQCRNMIRYELDIDLHILKLRNMSKILSKNIEKHVSDISTGNTFLNLLPI